MRVSGVQRRSFPVTRKPQDIAGGQEKGACHASCTPAGTTYRCEKTPGHEGFHGYHMLTWRDDRPAPASVQDQERPIAKPVCSCAEFWPGKGHPPDCPTQQPGVNCTGSTHRAPCFLAPPAPPIAKAGEPPAWCMEAAHAAFHLSDDQRHAARLIHAAFLASRQADCDGSADGTPCVSHLALIEAEARVERLEKALMEDAAVEPIPVLLRSAAYLLTLSGGGPIADRLRLAAVAIEEALADSAADEKGKGTR